MIHNQELSVGEVLYRGTHKYSLIGQEFECNSVIESKTLPLSAYAGRAKAKKVFPTINILGNAKTSNVFAGLEQLLANKLRIGKLDDSVVFEIVGDNTRRGVIGYDKNLARFNITLSEGWDESPCYVGGTALFAYAMGTDEKYNETCISANNMMQQYATITSKTYDASVTAWHAIGVCDNLYYETIAMAAAKGVNVCFDTNQGTIDMLFSKTTEITHPETIIKMGFAIPFDESEETVAEVNEDQEMQEWYQRAINGEFIVNGAFSIEDAELIPPLSELTNFVPTKEFVSALRYIHGSLKDATDAIMRGEPNAIMGNHVNQCFHGDPGGGKTKLAYALAAATGLPYRIVACNPDIESDTFNGKNVVIDGVITKVSTAFMDAFERGGIVVLEEHNLMRPGLAAGALNQAMEAPFKLNKFEQGEISRHPLCVVIATMNYGLEGTMDQNMAYLSRFSSSYAITPPPKEAFIEVIAKASHCTEKGYKTAVTSVYNFYCDMLDLLKSADYRADDCTYLITMRHCIDAMRHIRYGETLEQALRNTFLNALSMIGRPEIAEKLKVAILSRVSANKYKPMLGKPRLKK